MIDAHHHIWRQADLPWLTGPELPRIFGPYGPIRRDYLIDEFLADLAGTSVEKSVYVQANWAPEAFEDEIAWTHEVGDAHGWPHAVVGYLDFTEPDLSPKLERLASYPRLRGFRQQFHWHENPLYRFAPTPDHFDKDVVRRNIGRLASHGWSFDLQVFAPQMADACRLIDACPDVTFILQHAGMLEDQSDAGWAAWRQGMAALAERPNVLTKLSAFGTFIHRNDPDFIRRMVGETVEIFGAGRCMFGSNFPIEKLWTDYRSLFDAFQAATADLSASDRQSIFNDVAAGAYRL